MAVNESDVALTHLPAIADEQIAAPVEAEARLAAPAKAARRWSVGQLLLAADFVGIAVAFVAAEVLASHDRPASFAGAVTALSVSVLVVAFGAKLYGLYDDDKQTAAAATIDDFPRIFHVVTVAAWMCVVVAWATHVFDVRAGEIATFWLLAILAIPAARSATRAIARRRGWCAQNAIIVGGGDVGQVLARTILNHPEYGINLRGFVDSHPKERRDDLGELTLLGPISSVQDIVNELEIDRVLIAFSNDSHQDMLNLTRDLKTRGVQVDIVPRLFETLVPDMNIGAIEGIPVVTVPPFRLSRVARLTKRAVDIIGSTLGLIVLGPLLAFIAVAIKLDSPGPIVFAQRRMGARDRPFGIYKFRTMTLNADSHKSEILELNKHRHGDPRMFKAPDDPRVTRVGRFLRRYSLDELLQLVNVVKGDMSLVGPRPLVLDEDVYVEEWARGRLTLRPGMTGLWQVLGRTDIAFEEMVRLDYLYVTNWTLASDLRILARTVPAVMRRQDAY